MGDQLSETAQAFLTARGLDVELAVSKGLFSEKGAGGGEALVFPFIRQGQVINHKRRTITGEKRFWQDKGADKAAWNEDCLRDDTLLTQPVIITEGEFDALAAIQSGFLRTVSVPDGAPPPGNRDADSMASSPKYSWLLAIRPLLHKERAPEIIIAADNDANGAALLHDLALQFGRARCKYLIYPKARDPDARGRERLKDLNEVLEDYGMAGVVRTIEGARYLKVEGVYRMSELPEPPPSVVWELSDAFALLRENMKFRPGDLSVVTGIPSYGKTTFVNAIWGDLIEGYGITVAWASFEQQTKPDHRRNLRNWYMRTGLLASAQQLQEADAWIERHHLFIQPSEDEDATLHRVLELGEAAAIQHNARVLVIDPWNELEHVRERHMSLTEYVNSSLREVRRFAKAFKMHVMILAHPTKSVKGEGGTYRIPTMYDISDSAGWYNKAELGVIVHRPNADETQVAVEKSRYHEQIGVPGTAFLHFSRETRRYTEIGRASMFREAG